MTLKHFLFRSITCQDVNNATEEASVLGDICTYKSNLAEKAYSYWRLMERLHGVDSLPAIRAHEEALNAKHECVKAVNHYRSKSRDSDLLLSHYLANQVIASAMRHVA